jgi:hypothetical protein
MSTIDGSQVAVDLLKGQNDWGSLRNDQTSGPILDLNRGAHLCCPNPRDQDQGEALIGTVSRTI